MDFVREQIRELMEICMTTPDFEGILSVKDDPNFDDLKDFLEKE